MTTTVFSTSVITTSYDTIFSYAASGDSLIVNAGVTLSTQGDWAVYGRGTNGLSDLHATINGTVFAGGWAAVDAFESSIHVVVGSTGRLETSYGAMTLEASYDSTLENHGTMYTDRGFGAVFNYVTDASVENWGTIHGEVGGVTFSGGYSNQNTTSASFVNHGTVEAGGRSNDLVYGSGQNQAVWSNTDTTTIINDGSIFAADKVGAGIKLDGAAATITNSGTIESARYWGLVANTGAVELDNSGTISGAKGSILLSGGGADVVTNDGHLGGLAQLGGGNDVYHGENGSVSGAVWGQSGNDLLAGGASADVLGGGSGDDTLIGGAGADTLTGSTGGDRISGGAGDDVFRFAAAGEASGDAIVASGGALAFAGAGVAGGDRIDVSAIDANTTLAGVQHFTFGTTQGLGELWAVDVGDITHIRGNTAGGSAPEFDLAINDGAGVHASDYAGVDFIL